MKIYYITFRSVTYAQRGEHVLEKEGIRSSLQRTPRWMEEQGCGYALRVWTRDILPAVEALKGEGVAWRRIYLQGRDGQLQEISL